MVEWLSETPDDWEIRRFSWLGRMIGGGTPSKSEPAYWDGEIPWVSPKDMKKLRIYDTEDHITEKGIRNSSTSLVPAGTVLIVTRSGILRRTLPVAITSRPMALNQDLKALVPSRDVAAAYLAYWLKAHGSLLLSIWRKEGTTVESLETALIRETPVPVPPLPRQRAIAFFLDRETDEIDTLIERKHRLLDLLEEKRTALITRAVTRGLNPDVSMKHSEVEWLGKIPEHWEVAKVKHVARMESGHTPDRKIPDYWEGGIQWLSLADSRLLKAEDAIKRTTFQISPAGLANSSARLLPPGTVVFSRDATVGLCAILRTEMAVSQHFIGWVCSPRILPEYLLLVLKSMSQELDRLTMGATIRTLGLPEVSSLSTPIPPLDEQAAITTHVADAEQQIEALSDRVTHAVSLLKEYRTALMAAAVTGKIDVRDKVPA